MRRDGDGLRGRLRGRWGAVPGRARAGVERTCVCVFVGARACVVAVLRVIKRRIEWSADNEEANSDERRRSALRLSPASLASLTRWTPPSRPADRECHPRPHARALAQSFLLFQTAHRLAWRRCPPRHRLPQRGHIDPVYLLTVAAPPAVVCRFRFSTGVLILLSHIATPVLPLLFPTSLLYYYQLLPATLYRAISSSNPARTQKTATCLCGFPTAGLDTFVRHAFRLRSHHIRSKDQGRCPSTACCPYSPTSAFPQIFARLTRLPLPGRIHHRSRQQDVPLRVFSQSLIVKVLCFLLTTENRVVDSYPSARWSPTCISLTFRRLFGAKSSQSPTTQSQVPATFTALTLVSFLLHHLFQCWIYTLLCLVLPIPTPSMPPPRPFQPH